ncbi:AAA family ATPase [Adhaeribacter soli]|uniref:AAA family ATPase n=1 Tax=Adhaeribacter soli TaxID=2607655 RepID=A0A5N1ISQ4_9BACT|nr:AAA family ATPase [Adhaeribacter soli]KAA9331140.1 AAA family ATPase [Adhaeribacter soli]
MNMLVTEEQNLENKQGSAESPNAEPAAIPTVITARQLANIEGTTNERFLLEPFLPIIGTALVAGQPDTGKSQFARQLAIIISHGVNAFLGFPLKLTHSKAIYLATEDDPISCKELQIRQHSGLGLVPNENLRFIFPEVLDQRAILQTLDTALEAEPADLVVVDSFSDVFGGSDMNSNTQMRQTVNSFDALAKKHKCLILFVHHINKAAYGKNPTQQGIQGGSGLTQKVRLAWQISPGEANKKYLAVTKGNYCPREFKEKALVLTFDEETFIFSRTSETVEASNLITAQEAEMSRAEREFENCITIVKDGLDSNQGLSYTELTELIMEKMEVSEATAKRRIGALAEAKYIKKGEDRNYFWDQAIDSSEYSDMDNADGPVDN